ncbi:Protein GUCD1 [Orchesella cincta]|uniref:Protein GUCD1 n=1 Tax=Orchesella cincta TaxID=48709 RepID=A0A1D2MF79_ORCCI|nr:Protein GUCD1 [Orchesella cincta]
MHIMDEINVQAEVFHNVPHVQQQHEWDCGIASVAMTVSNQIAKGNLETVVTKLKNEPNEGFGQRPWTIDLCHILSLLNVSYKYFTASGADVNPNLYKLQYYTKSFKQDESRVRALLSNSKLQADIWEGSLNSLEFVQCLKRGPLIVLVDANKLECKRHQSLRWRPKFCWNWNTSFLGHYIVIIGHSPKTNVIYYRNPSVTNRICETSLQILNEARLAIGTDEDIILVEGQTYEISTSSMILATLS